MIRSRHHLVAAGPHPLRQQLRLRALRRRVRAPHPWITAQDVRDFLLAYCACFMAVSAFIA